MKVKLVVTNEEWAKDESYSGGDLARVLLHAGAQILNGHFEGDYQESHWVVEDDDE